MRTILQGKVILIGFLLAAGVLMAQGPARADTVSAIIAADNHFTFYVGDATGSTLTYIGRNMYGADNGEVNNWQQAITFSGVPVQPGQYLYIAAWNEDGPQMWVGEFTKSGGAKLYSNTSDWVFTMGSGANPGVDGDLDYNTVKQDIATGVWATPQVQADFLDENMPWTGGIDTFDSSTQAKYLWHDTFDEGSSSQLTYAIFRNAAPVTASPATQAPVPSTMFLLGSGLVGLGLLRGKRRLKK